MQDDRNAARALVVGTIGSFVTMGLHPTGGEMMAGGEGSAVARLATAVHALAIAVQPLMLMGMLALTRRLRGAPSLAGTAYAAFAVATGAVVMAAAASGLLGPAVAFADPGTDEATRAVARGMLDFTHVINQAFAQVYVCLMGGALVLWSLAMAQHAEFPRLLRGLGMLVGSAAVLGVLSGHLQLDIHGFGAVMVAQGVWVLWMATVLHGTPSGVTQ